MRTWHYLLPLQYRYLPLSMRVTIALWCGGTTFTFSRTFQDTLLQAVVGRIWAYQPTNQPTNQPGTLLYIYLGPLRVTRLLYCTILSARHCRTRTLTVIDCSRYVAYLRIMSPLYFIQFYPAAGHFLNGALIDTRNKRFYRRCRQITKVINKPYWHSGSAVGGDRISLICNSQWLQASTLSLNHTLNMYLGWVIYPAQLDLHCKQTKQTN
jgi:hypothetical protein